MAYLGAKMLLEVPSLRQDEREGGQKAHGEAKLGRIWARRPKLWSRRGGRRRGERPREMRRMTTSGGESVRKCFRHGPRKARRVGFLMILRLFVESRNIKGGVIMIIIIVNGK